MTPSRSSASRSARRKGALTVHTQAVSPPAAQARRAAGVASSSSHRIALAPQPRAAWTGWIVTGAPTISPVRTGGASRRTAASVPGSNAVTISHPGHVVTAAQTPEAAAGSLISRSSPIRPAASVSRSSSVTAAGSSGPTGSWASTSRPSASSRTSVSITSAPAAIAVSNAASELSGRVALAPRCAQMSGAVTSALTASRRSGGQLETTSRAEASEPAIRSMSASSITNGGEICTVLLVMMRNRTP